MNPISKLGVGPMSEEIIDAVFNYSEKHSEPLMLIASKNQIDWNGGYVNNWTTREYMNFVKLMRSRYSQAKVYICRDHCGPGFKGKDLDDTYQTIDEDLENGFDLIHVDFCHYHGGKEEIIKESKKAIEYIKSKKTKTLIEIGTDENTGAFLEDVSAIEKEINQLIESAKIDFFVCQTGSLIKEVNQVGDFNSDFLKKIRAIADKYHILLKEHNADYLNVDNIKKRKGLIDAVNVAPQFGVIQTQLTIQKCLLYGIDFSEFIEGAYKSQRWQKWLNNNTKDNKFLCSMIAGHYIFASDAYKKICEKINKHENFKEIIINEIEKNIDMYIKNL